MTSLVDAVNTILSKFGARVKFILIEDDYVELLFNGWRRVLLEDFEDGLTVRVIERDAEGHEQFLDDHFAQWLANIIKGYVRDSDGNVRPASREG